MDKTDDLRKETDRSDDKELVSRREFFIGLKKWSKIVIGGAVLLSYTAWPPDRPS